MRKLLAFGLAASVLLASACSGGKGTEPSVQLSCDVTVPVTSLTKKDSQLTVNVTTNCSTVTVTSRTGAYSDSVTIPVQGSSVTIDLSSVSAGDNVTFVGNLDGKPASKPVSVAVMAPLVPVSLEIVYNGPSSVVTATQVKFRLKRTGAINCSDLITNMPILPDSAASVPRIIRSASDSDAVTLDVGTIVGAYGYTISCSGNDGSSVTKSISVGVTSVALTAVDSMTTWVPGDGSYEVHFYSKCGFAATNGKFDDPNRVVGSRLGFGPNAPGDVIYHNCSHISAILSSGNTPPQGDIVQEWLFQPGRPAFLAGTVQVGGPKP